jgi:hypothetical protein
MIIRLVGRQEHHGVLRTARPPDLSMTGREAFLLPVPHKNIRKYSRHPRGPLWSRFYCIAGAACHNLARRLPETLKTRSILFVQRDFLVVHGSSKGSQKSERAMHSRSVIG